MALLFSDFDRTTRYAHRRGIGIFSSGLQKYRSFDYAKQLFTEAYKIPLVDPAVAARAAMINELTCSTLLMLGIVTRVATLPLLAMLLVLQLVYPADWPNNVLWGSILLFLLTRGPGQFSVDRTIERHFVKRQ